MTKRLFLPALFFVAFWYNSSGQSAHLNYSIDLNDRADDKFKVVLQVDDLTSDNAIYQFAATAPGTYQTMNIGRFVSDFKAFDKKGREIATENISVNQWKVSNPAKVRRITYSVAETWDTPVEEYPVYRMSGTSLEADHVLINTHCVLGYPTGMQGEPLTLNLKYPGSWQVGTPLERNQAGAFYAKNYDFAVDSPILLGQLSEADTTLSGANIRIFTYSKTGAITSDDLLDGMMGMLNAAGAFLVNFPVDRYTFLYHFEDQSAGAWEHSYSSEYVMQEQPYSQEYAEQITSIAAHEFFHVVTPLNIHSEIIAQFNFVTPTPSEHLWLYEATTEWASDIMQLRYGSMDLETYLSEQRQKLVIDSYYNPNYSLSELSLNSYTPQGAQQYGNIYMRGAVVAGLLDIRLMDLSGGTRGLREVINELSKKYGPERAFPEKEFFSVFTSITYPEIGDFFEKYIKHAEPLPLAEYYGKLGIKFVPEVKTGESEPDRGIAVGVPDGKIRLTKLRPDLEEQGLVVNDEIVKLNGEEVTLQNAQQVFGPLRGLEIGDSYTITVKHDDQEVTAEVKVLSKEKVEKFVFEVDENATAEQKKLREAWMKNL